MPRPALIATIPRSGTWYCHLFFWTYDWLLQHKWRHALLGARPSIINGALHGGAHDKTHTLTDMQDYSTSLGINPLYIFHTMCPGYERAHDPLRSEWDKLNFSLPYSSHERMKEDFNRLDPGRNADARIVYLYRNPLDHFISFFRVTQAHVWDGPRTKEVNGVKVPVSDLQDWIFNASALESYLKQFHTFKVMSAFYPRNILMIPYEQLAADPRRRLLEILGHLGAPIRGPLARRAFDTAFEMTSKDQVIKIERTMDRSLGGELKGSERHVGSGRSGQWKDRLSASDLAEIDRQLGRLRYSLAGFQLN